VGGDPLRGKGSGRPKMTGLSSGDRRHTPLCSRFATRGDRGVIALGSLNAALSAI